jgi:hypothetical protein
VVLVAPAVAVLVLVSYQFQNTTMRYEVEFAPLFALGSLLGWVVWNRSLRHSNWIQWLGNGLWIAALAVSVAFSIAITSTPCAGTGSC